MIQLTVGLVFAALVLNGFSFMSKTDKNAKKLFVVVEILLGLAIMFATIYANK